MSKKNPREHTSSTGSNYPYLKSVIIDGAGVTSTSFSGSGSAPSCSFAAYPSF